MSVKNVIDEAATYGIIKDTVLNGDNSRRVVWRVTCACGNEHEKTFGIEYPPIRMINEFKALHWGIERRRMPECPDCLSVRRAFSGKRRKQEHEPEITYLNGAAPPPSEFVAEPVAEPVVETVQQKVADMPAIDNPKPVANYQLAFRLYAAFEEFFSKETGQYLKGMSDAKLAEQYSTSAEFVANLREEVGLKLREDPEIVAMREEMGAISRQIVELRATFEAMLKSEIDGLDARARAIEAKLVAKKLVHHKAGG